MNNINNTIYRGDCLYMGEHKKMFPYNSVDLIYLDPPFSSNRNYAANYKDSSGVKSSFDDTWKGHLEAYIDYMRPRLIQLRRVLKPTGSIYYHCDYHASHYVRILLDEVFGAKNFQNEIIWCYNGGGGSKKHFGRKHDNIYFYTKSGKYKFNQDDVRVPYTEGGGTWQAQKSGKVMNKKVGKGVHKWKPSDKGKVPEDWWTIPFINPMAKERVGYPTQKPIALLSRIIKASSNEGDVVLDPFMGSGTTIVSAALLNRKFIGIDVNSSACDVAVNRLWDHAGYGKISRDDIVNLIGGKLPDVVGGESHDIGYMRWIALNDPFNFQRVCCNKLGGEPSTKKSDDHGIDGQDYDSNPIQVKGSDKVGRQKIQSFKGALDEFNKTKGTFIAFSFVKSAYDYVAKIKREHDVNIVLIRVEDLPKVDMKSRVKVLSDFGDGSHKKGTRIRPVIKEGQKTIFDY